MKILRIGDDILSLENVRRVSIESCGTGAKSNPYHFYIRVQYIDKQHESVEVDSMNQAQTYYNIIADILEGKTTEG